MDLRLTPSEPTDRATSRVATKAGSQPWSDAAASPPLPPLRPSDGLPLDASALDRRGVALPSPPSSPSIVAPRVWPPSGWSEQYSVTTPDPTGCDFLGARAAIPVSGRLFPRCPLPPSTNVRCVCPGRPLLSCSCLYAASDNTNTMQTSVACARTGGCARGHDFSATRAPPEGTSAPLVQ